MKIRWITQRELRNQSAAVRREVEAGRMPQYRTSESISGAPESRTIESTHQRVAQKQPSAGAAWGPTTGRTGLRNTLFRSWESTAPRGARALKEGLCSPANVANRNCYEVLRVLQVLRCRYESPPDHTARASQSIRGRPPRSRGWTNPNRDPQRYRCWRTTTDQAT